MSIFVAPKFQMNIFSHCKNIGIIIAMAIPVLNNDFSYQGFLFSKPQSTQWQIDCRYWQKTISGSWFMQRATRKTAVLFCSVKKIALFRNKKFMLEGKNLIGFCLVKVWKKIAI